MKTNLLRYNVIIKKEGGLYIADVPTLGISDFGKTVNEAKSNVKNAIEIHISGLMKTKTRVPQPDINEQYISQAEVPMPANIQFAY